MKDRMFALVLAALCAALLVTPRAAWAHKPSDSYMIVKRGPGAALDVRWDIALRDIDDAVGLGKSRAAGEAVQWSDIDARRTQLAAWAFGRLAFTAAGAKCTLTPDTSRAALAEHSDGAYLVLGARASCPELRDVVLHYDLLFDIDAQHRSVVRVESSTPGTTSESDGSVVVATASRRELSLDRGLGLALDPSAPAVGGVRAFAHIVLEGVHHILSGYDHILFLTALLLPAVLRRERKTWLPRDAWRPVLVDVTKVVTAFTVAHSLTLGLAGLGLVSLPSRFVESAIAASVMVAALNNVFPFLPLDRWTAAFVLGLMHGFGFSSALADVGARGTALVTTLFGFNLGVELGQLSIVALLLPIAFFLRNRRIYTPVVLRFGSLVILSVAGVWFYQRAF